MSDCAPGLDDDQLAWLQEQLMERAEQHGGMPLDVAHGFITAAVSGPRLVLPMEWLPAVLGQPQFGAESEAEALNGALLTLYNDILHELDHAHYGPVVVYKPVERAEPLPLPYGWCQGYVQGLHLHGEGAVEEAATDERAAEFLAPIAAFLMYEEKELLDPPDEAGHRQTAAELGGSAQGLFDWWRQTRQ
jgi:uncharacterized protein